MRLRADGTIAVPPEYQKELGWKPGDQVELKIASGALVVRQRPQAAAANDDFISNLRGKGRLKLRTREVMQLLRGSQ